MPPANGNGHSSNAHVRESANVDAERVPSFQDLVTEAEQLRAQAQDLAARLTRLISGLKQFRRQGREVQAAVQSIRGLRLEE